MYALKIDNVCKSYRARGRVTLAAGDVSFYVNEGECVGLLGMNGAGKSTVVKICTGLISADGGSVSVFGHDMSSDPENAKKYLNVSPQETAVAGNLTVRENLELISRMYGADKAQARLAAERITEALRLGDKSGERAKKLSGGLMRRLSIGMALITEPKLVFLDEPTLGLDVVARRELWRYIKALRPHTAAVLTTHYLEEAESLCDRIVIMKKGKVAATGTAEELKAQSKSDSFEQAFLRITGEEDGYDE